MCAFCSCPTGVKGSLAFAVKKAVIDLTGLSSFPGTSECDLHWWNFTGARTPPQGDDYSPSEEPWGEIV